MKKFINICVIFISIIFIFGSMKKIYATEEQMEQQEEQSENENTETKDPVKDDEAEPEQQSEEQQSTTPDLEYENYNESTYEEKYNSSEEQYTKSSSSSSQVVDWSESNNNYLKKLVLDAEGITPEFDKNTDTYYVVVPLEINSIKVTAETEDDNARVSISGNTNLPEGESTITITVTAEDNSKRYYKIKVTRTDDIAITNANLKELSIEGYDIEFDELKYKYTIEIKDNVSQLLINAVTENEKATYVIEGNENFSNGENKVVIKVTAEDGTTQKEYYIYAVKGFEEVNVKEENSLLKILILGVCAAIFVTCFIILIVRSRKKF